MKPNMIIAAIAALIMIATGGVDASTPAKLKLLPSAIATGAVCLDGTAPGYYFRAGSGAGANKWLIHHQGGGWCYNEQDCVARSKTALGSSKTWGPTMNGGGIFNQDPKLNPDFHDWNIAYFMYCDGASFSGDVSQPLNISGTTIYFRGFRVENALLDDLPLSTATHILVSGCSAGGLATFLHADHISQRFPRAVVKAMPDAGFFMDVPDWHGNYSIRAKYTYVFKMQNATGGVNQQCIRSNTPENQWKCFMAQYTVLYMSTPVLVLNSLYDSWQLGNILLLPSSCAQYPTSHNCTAPQLASFEGLHNAMLVALEPVMASSGDGIWALSCLVHCLSGSDQLWAHVHIQGNLARDVVGNWFNDRSGTHHIEDVTYPHNKECPKHIAVIGPNPDWYNY